jgi:membrane protease YdiL (CAAX protease family)
MLFYIKRFLGLEILVTLLLGGVGYCGMRWRALAFVATPTPRAIAFGFLGAGFLTIWTLLVQYGYAFFKGQDYADRLTASLAKQYGHAGAAQIILGGLTAACGEEIFFRGFLQQTLGLALASLLFMLAHFGKRDIRVVSLWSIFQGIYLGLFFMWSRNLLVPMIAHGLFDFGGMIYFRSFMTRFETTA